MSGTRELPAGEGPPDVSGKRSHTPAQVFRLLGRDRMRAVEFLCRVYLRLDSVRGAGLFPGHGTEDLDRRIASAARLFEFAPQALADDKWAISLIGEAADKLGATGPVRESVIAEAWAAAGYPG